MLSFMTSGLALMEVEICAVYIRLFKWTYYVGFPLLGADDGAGVIMLVLISGPGATVNMPGEEQLAPLLLGVPIFMRLSGRSWTSPA